METKTKTKTKKVDTWLPIFSGYYHSIFDQSEDYVYRELDMSDDEIRECYSEVFEAGVSMEFFRAEFSWYLDFRAAENACSEYIANGLVDLEHADIIENVVYQKTVNPKYYNFSTDSINVEIEYNTEKLKKYISENKEAFKEYIKGKYTSYDGFISSYTNEADQWIEDINNDDLCSHSLGSVLQFVIVNHYDNEYHAEVDLYEQSNCYEGYSNGMIFDSNGMIEAFKRKQKEQKESEAK